MDCHSLYSGSKTTKTRSTATAYPLVAPPSLTPSCAKRRYSNDQKRPLAHARTTWMSYTNFGRTSSSATSITRCTQSFVGTLLKMHLNDTTRLVWKTSSSTTANLSPASREFRTGLPSTTLSSSSLNRRSMTVRRSRRCERLGATAPCPSRIAKS